VNPPMGQVIGGWIGAMIVLGIAGGWLFAPTEVTLHTVPMSPDRTATSSLTDQDQQEQQDQQDQPAPPAAEPQPADRGRGEP
jgi:hypothetical protein